ncbi:MAG TPA: nuclear transport factor 2 family protein [Actinophytocola sp.]|jgi:ketosteroid isomerase-like protein|uniref:nuclear transport factor 2 family protein n=1 Tax=Actinophytocola sp. TaxID=1872138 RepID=UPI002F9551D5
MSTTETTFAVERFRRGIEERDTNALLSMYADDAEIRIVDRTSPPSGPRVLRGRQAIAEYLTDVNGRDMTHELERVVAQPDGVAYLEACRYADGTRVLCSAVLDLAGGRIVRQSGVQAWDE